MLRVCLIAGLLMVPAAVAMAEDRNCYIEVVNKTDGDFGATVYVEYGKTVTINGDEKDNAKGKTYDDYTVASGGDSFIAEMKVGGTCGLQVTLSVDDDTDVLYTTADGTYATNDCDKKGSTSGFLKSHDCKCVRDKGNHHSSIVLTCG